MFYSILNYAMAQNIIKTKGAVCAILFEDNSFALHIQLNETICFPFKNASEK